MILYFDVLAVSNKPKCRGPNLFWTFLGCLSDHKSVPEDVVYMLILVVRFYCLKSVGVQVSNSVGGPSYLG